MIIGKVVDHLIATRKQPSYTGQKLLVIQPLTLEGFPQGETILAIDGADAGIGDQVLVVQEGWSAMHVLGQFNTPVDAAVIGVIDQISLFDSQ